ncbi:hypothetical protein AQUCO_04800011v1 [Aquilegia coerulea]|uniref:Uncharacterized protein n=1 Tax=Aquilegia coerulea TaxID=218851 RepID=A0A2G5CKH9_AQUCA|nr:hypothetical protein AQUCO_04800011v1 [Aquilegia coerulea]
MKQLHSTPFVVLDSAVYLVDDLRIEFPSTNRSLTQIVKTKFNIPCCGSINFVQIYCLNFSNLMSSKSSWKQPCLLNRYITHYISKFK